MLRNGSSTSGGTFHLQNFDLNEIVINNNNSNIILNHEYESKINPFQKNDICDKQKNNNNINIMNGVAKVKAKEKILLRKELDLIKKAKKLEKKEKTIDAKADELEKKEKTVYAREMNWRKKKKLLIPKQMN